MAEFLNWLDNWEGVEYIIFSIVGLGFLVSIYAIGYMRGIKYYQSIQDILFSDLKINVKLRALKSLIPERRKEK